MAFTDSEIKELLDAFLDLNTERQYIGARYVPIFGRKDEDSIEWDNTKPYEPLTIVLYQGNSFTSRQYVPVGVEISNQEFWANTGNYNAQVEAYRQEVTTLAESFDDVEDQVDELTARIDAMGLDERVPFEIVSVDAEKIGTIPFNHNLYYAQSMCNVGDYLYVYFAPISGQATYPMLNKYSYNIAETATFTLENSLIISDTNYTGHGNSLSYNLIYNCLVWTTSSRRALVFYDVETDSISGKYDLGSIEGYNNVLFSTDGTRFFACQSGGRCYYIGDIGEGVCAINSYIPFPEIGRCTLADLTFKSNYIYQAMWNTRTENATYIMAMAFNNGYCPYIINAHGIIGETEGIEWIGGNLYICTSNGDFYRMDALPSDSISEGAAGIRIPCLSARGLMRKYVNSQGKNIWFTPFIPMFADSVKVLKNHAFVYELPQGSTRKLGCINRAATGFRENYTDYASNELDIGCTLDNNIWRYNRIKVNDKEQTFAASLSASDYIDALKAYFDDPGIASGTQYYNQFYACGSEVNLSSGLSFIFPGYDNYGLNA